MIRRKMILYLLALLIVLFLPGSGSAPAAQLTINENNSGETLTLYPGDIMELTLESNPSTGYAWQGDLNIAGVLEVIEHGFKSRGVLPGEILAGWQLYRSGNRIHLHRQDNFPRPGRPQ
jgi:hypothetical protein